MGNKTDPPYIRRFYAYQYGPVEFSPVSRKSLKEVLDRTIYDFYSGCLLQNIIEQFDEFTHYKRGRHVPHSEYNYDYQNKPESGYASWIAIFIQRQAGKKPVNEIRQDAVDPVK